MSARGAKVILTSKIPNRDVAWEGKLMAIRQGETLFLPVAFCREGAVPFPHREILDIANFKTVRRGSPENMGGCLVKVFMGTVILWSQSGEFGVLKEQEALLEHGVHHLALRIDGQRPFFLIAWRAQDGLYASLQCINKLTGDVVLAGKQHLEHFVGDDLAHAPLGEAGDAAGRVLVGDGAAAEDGAGGEAARLADVGDELEE